MASAIERQYLRDDVYADEIALPDTAADKLLDRAAAKYPTNDAAKEAHARVLAIRQLIAGAATQVDYQQGESMEKASQTRPSLEALLKEWKAAEKEAVEDAAKQATGGPHWAGLRRKPTRLQEYPDTF